MRVSPIQAVRKKGCMIVVKNENNELIPTRIVIGWIMCINYRKLNKATGKDHFSLTSRVKCLKGLLGTPIFGIGMIIQVSFKFLSILAIRKRLWIVIQAYLKFLSIPMTMMYLCLPCQRPLNKE